MASSAARRDATHAQLLNERFALGVRRLLPYAPQPPCRLCHLTADGERCGLCKAVDALRQCLRDHEKNG